MNSIPSYEEYLQATKQPDSRLAWQYWKIMFYNMSEKQAIKESYKLKFPLLED